MKSFWAWLGAGLMIAVCSLPLQPAAAAALGDGWLAGRGATGANTYSGVIDSPADRVRVATVGTVLLSGWIVDRTAEGWAGIDDVEIYLGTMDNGGSLVTHAGFAQQRPDVAGTFGRPDWLASGWSALISSSTLVPGQNLLSVYVHSPSKGWWYRQLTVEVGMAATSQAAPSFLGYDVSFPQCDQAEPRAPAFVVIGVNGGRLFTGNPCLARQYVWGLTSSSPVQPRVGFYMNTGNPGPVASAHWPQSGQGLPRSCDGSWSTDCAYDYGWLGAADAFARGRSAAGEGATLAPWWLDVESANSWSSDTSTNSAALQGAVEYLRSMNVGTIGIYALAAEWESIVGPPSSATPQTAPFSQLPNWRPGPRTNADAPNWCTRTVTGGRVLIVQYPEGGFDRNLPCP